MSYLRITCIVGILLASVCACANEPMPGKSETTGDCSSCHSSANPSKDDLFPRNCSRAQEEPLAKIMAPEDVPDVFILDQMSDLYVPVVFPHRLHASMESMSEGCSVCHHHGHNDKIMACRSCHDGETNPENLRQPGLKGAYHRQCMSCHREWSHDTDCTVCHAKRKPGQPMPQIDKTDILGSLHPQIETPDKWVYTTAGMDDTVVTFHHKEHTSTFGKRCVDCHAKENCSRCHDAAAAPQKHVRQDPHEDCAKCHDISDDCTRCHQKEETPDFSHFARTGFALKPFHKELGCKRCHGDTNDFTGLKKDCLSCHDADWMPETFDHAKTGLSLDDLHGRLDCAACHAEGLTKPTQCKACHDDGRSYPDASPGAKTAS